MTDDTTTEECHICYENGSSVHFLSCCKGKRICSSCLKCLRVPLCPYCRSIIPEIRNDPRYHLSCSFIPVSQHLFTEQAGFLMSHGILDETLDPRLLDSRILRRRLRRLRKLQLRGLL